MTPDLPPPARTDDIKQTVDEMLYQLAAGGHMTHLGEGPSHVHMIASLTAELRVRLAEAIALTYAQDHDWPDIARLAGLPVDDTETLAATVTQENYMAD